MYKITFSKNADKAMRRMPRNNALIIAAKIKDINMSGYTIWVGRKNIPIKSKVYDIQNGLLMFAAERSIGIYEPKVFSSKLICRLLLSRERRAFKKIKVSFFDKVRIVPV